MKKKLAVLLMIVATVCCFCFAMSACDLFGGGGNEDENKDFVFEITEDGKGAILTEYHGDDSEVTVPAEYEGLPVVEISSALRSNADNITKVILPDSVKVIQEHAFDNMQILEEVVFSANLESIGDLAFINCALKSVILPASVKSIGRQAFDDNSNLTEFILPSDSQLREINFHAFSGCTSLKTVKLADSIETLEEKSFTGCSSLESIDIKNVKKLGNSCFRDCTSLKTVNFGDCLEEVGYSILEGTAVTEVILPQSCKIVSPYAFSNMVNLKTLYVPSGAKLDSSALSGSVNIEKLTIPYSAPDLPALFNVGSANNLGELLTKFTTLEIIGEGSIEGNFKNIPNLANVTISEQIYGAPREFLKGTAWYNDQPEGFVYCGNVLLGYKGAAPTGVLKVKEGVKGIANDAFSECTGITAVDFADSVIQIGAWAFEKCNSLDSIVCPENLEIIGYDAFRNCGLTSVIFNDKLKEIASNAFNDNNLTEVVLPETVEELGYGCFANTMINKITLPFNGSYTLKDIGIASSLTELTVLGSYLPEKVAENSRLTKVTLSDKITEIPASAFSRSNISEIKWGNIVSIGDHAFNACVLTSLVFPETLKSIGNWAFANNRSLQSVKFNSKLESIGENAFSLNTQLASVDLSATGVKEIGNGAFSFCGALATVKLGDKLEKIGDNAFINTNINKIIIPSSVTYVGRQILNAKSLDSNKFADFAIFVEAPAPDSSWHKYWNLNMIDQDGSGNDVEETANFFPTYYYSEEDKESDELSYWHYVDGEPVKW